jgi:hypothetical protein
MFFGTPHQGTNGMSEFFLSLVSTLNIRREGSVVKELKLWSPSLVEANTLFAGIADNFTVTTFYERERYKGIQVCSEHFLLIVSSGGV